LPTKVNTVASSETRAAPAGAPAGSVGMAMRPTSSALLKLLSLRIGPEKKESFVHYLLADANQRR